MTPANRPVESQAIGIGLLSFTAWGLFPIYWWFLRDLAPLELLAHRFIWSFVFYLVVCLWFFRRGGLPRRAPSFRDWLGATLATSILAMNWGLYIYAVNSGRVLESSLAYFLNPLLNVGVGVLFFRESFPWALRVAVLLAALGIATQLIGASDVPWISLVLACTFCAYGIVKKVMPVEPMLGSLMEGAVGFVPGLVAAVVLREQSSVEQLTALHWALFAGSGVVSGIPLMLFAYAAQRLPYSLLGVLQFVAPSLQFMVGWLIFHESLTPTRLIAFSLVWAGVAFYLTDRLYRLRTEQLRGPAPPLLSKVPLGKDLP